MDTIAMRLVAIQRAKAKGGHVGPSKPFGADPGARSGAGGSGLCGPPLASIGGGEAAAAARGLGPDATACDLASVLLDLIGGPRGRLGRVVAAGSRCRQRPLPQGRSPASLFP
eukprot:4300411-Lingulodinium_polyedra.AAC.1